MKKYGFGEHRKNMLRRLRILADRRHDFEEAHEYLGYLLDEGKISLYEWYFLYRWAWLHSDMSYPYPLWRWED